MEAIKEACDKLLYILQQKCQKEVLFFAFVCWDYLCCLCEWKQLCVFRKLVIFHRKNPFAYLEEFSLCTTLCVTLLLEIMSQGNTDCWLYRPKIFIHRQIQLIFPLLTPLSISVSNTWHLLPFCVLKGLNIDFNFSLLLEHTHTFAKDINISYSLEM